MERRFETRYYPSLPSASAPSARGFAATIGGAVRASVTKVFMHQYGPGCQCVIHDRELEMDLMVVRMTAAGLQANYTADVLAVHDARPQRLRRVK